MIEVTPSADLYCDGEDCKTETLYDIPWGDDDWALPEGWVELGTYAQQVERDRMDADGKKYRSTPQHLCPSCAHKHEPVYSDPSPLWGSGEVYVYCRYCGQEKPCVGEKDPT